MAITTFWIVGPWVILWVRSVGTFGVWVLEFLKLVESTFES